MEDDRSFDDEPRDDGEAAAEEEPLGDDEREALKQDLTDIEILKTLLGSRGIRGAVFYCPDCDEDHYLGWDLLAGNLQELLSEGKSPVHEPAFEPNPDEYVSWDYGRGFLDGYESFEDEDLTEIKEKLTVELRRRGWERGQVETLLSAVGLDDGGEAKVPRW